MHTARNIGLERKCEVVSKRAIGRMTFGQTVGNFSLPLSTNTERGFHLRAQDRTLVFHHSSPFLSLPRPLQPSTVMGTCFKP